MQERILLPEAGRTTDFYAEFTLQEMEGFILATNGWINAPGRGSEIMDIVQSKFQEIATTGNVRIVHRYEAATPAGKKFIQKRSDYRWKDRSYEGYSIYEKEFLP